MWSGPPFFALCVYREENTAPKDQPGPPALGRDTSGSTPIFLHWYDENHGDINEYQKFHDGYSLVIIIPMLTAVCLLLVCSVRLLSGEGFVFAYSRHTPTHQLVSST